MARSFDIFGTTSSAVLLGPQTVTATAAGTGIDVRDLSGQAVALTNVLNVSGTTPTWDIDVEDSDDDAATDPYAVFASFAQITVAGLYRLRVNLNGAKQWIRVNMTVAGTSPSAEIGITITGSRHRLPTG